MSWARPDREAVCLNCYVRYVWNTLNENKNYEMNENELVVMTAHYEVCK